MISKEVFDAVQLRLDATRRAPAAGKAKVEYLLRGKAFCGYCGSNLIGECGRSKTGVMYYYYTCGKRKRKRNCKKKNERKDFLEWYVVEQTLQYVLIPERMKYIADRIVAKYEEEFNDRRINDLERQIDKIDAQVNAAVDASLAAPEKARIRYFEKIETLETQRVDLELNLASLKIANSHRYTADQIVAWLKAFCSGDMLDEIFQRRIIDVLINSIYVYDDKIVIYYNVKDGKQVSYIDPLPDSDRVRISDTPPCH